MEDISGSATFDQQMHMLDGNVDGEGIEPNKVYPGEIVLEPIQGGVRVTARDSRHQILWGFIASKEMLDQHPCPVAVYSKLKELIGLELEARRLPTTGGGDDCSVEAAKKSIQSLDQAVRSLKKLVEVANVTEATIERAKKVNRVAIDAERLIRYEI